MYWNYKWWWWQLHKPSQQKFLGKNKLCWKLCKKKNSQTQLYDIMDHQWLILLIINNTFLYCSIWPFCGPKHPRWCVNSKFWITWSNSSWQIFYKSVFFGLLWSNSLLLFLKNFFSFSSLRKWFYDKSGAKSNRSERLGGSGTPWLPRVRQWQGWQWHAAPSQAHSQIGHYFFSYLLTCDAHLIEVLEIMAQMGQYIIFLSLKPIKVSSVFIVNYLKKNCRGRHRSEISKTNTKTLIP